MYPLDIFAVILFLFFGFIISLFIIGFTGALLVVPVVSLYMLPAIISFFRKTKNRWWIFFLTILFGGTGIGWIGLLIWSCLDEDGFY